MEEQQTFIKGGKYCHHCFWSHGGCRCFLCWERNKDKIRRAEQEAAANKQKDLEGWQRKHGPDVPKPVPPSARKKKK